jgi:hypothetical protein
MSFQVAIVCLGLLALLAIAVVTLSASTENLAPMLARALDGDESSYAIERTPGYNTPLVI